MNYALHGFVGSSSKLFGKSPRPLCLTIEVAWDGNLGVGWIPLRLHLRICWQVLMHLMRLRSSECSKGGCMAKASEAGDAELQLCSWLSLTREGGIIEVIIHLRTCSPCPITASSTEYGAGPGSRGLKGYSTVVEPMPWRRTTVPWRRLWRSSFTPRPRLGGICQRQSNRNP